MPPPKPYAPAAPFLPRPQRMHNAKLAIHIQQNKDYFTFHTRFLFYGHTKKQKNSCFIKCF